MKRWLTGLMCIAGAGMMSACFTPHSYVDPQYHKAGYESIQRLPSPIPAKVEAHFERNGKPLPAVDQQVRDSAEKTLRASGVFAPVSDGNPSTVIGVTANNIANMGGAIGRGIGVGASFGIVGTTVHDFYEFTLSYRDASNHEETATYQHAIHSTIGHAKAPAGLTSMTVADAFARVVEDVVLNFIQHLQEKGLIPRGN